MYKPQNIVIKSRKSFIHISRLLNTKCYTFEKKKKGKNTIFTDTTRLKPLVLSTLTFIICESLNVSPAHPWDVSPEVTSSVGRTNFDGIHQHRVALWKNQNAAMVIFSEFRTCKFVC